jgi:hypothetical protein
MPIKNSINSQIPIPLTDGGTGETTRQASINTLLDAASATTGHVPIKQANGDIIMQAPAEGGEELIYLNGTTTDATTITLGSFTIPDDDHVPFTILLSGRGPSNKNYWAKIDVSVRKNTGESAVIVGTRLKVQDSENSPGYNADVDVSGSDLRVRVTGAASEIVDWQAKVFFVSDAAGEDLIGTIGLYDNDVAIQWKDNGGTPQDAIKVDSNNNTILNASSGNEIQFANNGTASWNIKSDGKLLASSNQFIGVDADGSAVNTYLNLQAATLSSTADTALIQIQSVAKGGNLDLYSGSGGAVRFYPNTGTHRWSMPDAGGNAHLVFNASIAKLLAGTADGSDNSELVISSAGAQGPTRGAYLTMTGNEHSSTPGILGLVSGESGSIEFWTGGYNKRFSVNSSGTLISHQAGTIIQHDTADGSDTSYFWISAGGGIDYFNGTRGGSLLCFGNEASGNPGQALMGCGNASGAEIRLYTPGTSQPIKFATNGTDRWQVSGNGDLLPGSSSSYTLGSSSLPVLSGHIDYLTAYRIAAKGTGDLQLQTQTVDGSDNRGILMTNGPYNWTSSNSRGAYLYLWGNETGVPGDVMLSSGTAGDCRLLSANEVRFELGSNIVFGISGLTNNYYWQGSGGTLYLSVSSGSTRYTNFRSTAGGSHRVQVNGTTLNVPFTGVHIYKEKDDENLVAGEAVALENRKLVRCSGLKNKKCIGIITGETLQTDDDCLALYDSFQNKYERDDTDPENIIEKELRHVASVGDSYCEGLDGIRVCDLGGAIEAGDLLCVSSKAGFLQKQDDDLVHGYTVAKAVEDITFDENGECLDAYVYLLN